MGKIQVTSQKLIDKFMFLWYTNSVRKQIKGCDGDGAREKPPESARLVRAHDKYLITHHS